MFFDPFSVPRCKNSLMNSTHSGSLLSIRLCVNVLRFLYLTQNIVQLFSSTSSSMTRTSVMTESNILTLRPFWQLYCPCTLRWSSSACGNTNSVWNKGCGAKYLFVDLFVASEKNHTFNWMFAEESFLLAENQHQFCQYPQISFWL